MNEMNCPYCGVECADQKALIGHMALCASNPANATGVPESVAAPETTDPSADKHTTADEFATVGLKSAQKGHTVKTGSRDGKR